MKSSNFGVVNSLYTKLRKRKKKKFTAITTTINNTFDYNYLNVLYVFYFTFLLMYVLNQMNSYVLLSR